MLSEMLSVLELLPLDLYQRLAPARRARNSWMHALAPVSAQASAHSMELAFDLLRFPHGIDLDPAPDVMFGSGV
jgi:hypothetical protein